MKPKIICTLGPSSFKKKVLDQLKKEGVDIFRINLSHTSSKDIEKKIIYLKKNKIKKICLDTEGAQLRTSFLKKKIYLKKNKLVKIFCGNKECNKNNLYLYPNFNLSNIRVNSKIHIGFNNLVIKIIKNLKNVNYLYGRVIQDGFLESRKGVHVDQKLNLNCLTPKDNFALNIGIKHKINYYAVSFVNSFKDLVKIRNILGDKVVLISKIETLSAIKDLKRISKFSNSFLIDRGDLSRYVPIEKIPIAQEKILNQSKKLNLPVYIATNLLETMIHSILPTRAESNDIFSSLDKGASGLVLAAETAIGKYPIECVKFLKRCIQAFKNKKKII